MNKKFLSCAADQILSPVYIRDVIGCIIKIIDLNLNGIFHIGGPWPLKRIEILKLLIENVKQFKPLDIQIIGEKINEYHNLSEKWPINTSLNPGKIIKNLGHNFCDIPIVCKKIVEKYFYSSSNQLTLKVIETKRT